MPQTLIALSPEDLETSLTRAVRRALSTATDDGMRPQAGSPLGTRRHVAAVRRRLTAGRPGAAKVGRKYLLSPGALAEELGQVSAARVPPEDAGAELRRKLGMQ